MKFRNMFIRTRKAVKCRQKMHKHCISHRPTILGIAPTTTKKSRNKFLYSIKVLRVFIASAEQPFGIGSKWLNSADCYYYNYTSRQNVLVVL